MVALASGIETCGWRGQGIGSRRGTCWSASGNASGFRNASGGTVCLGLKKGVHVGIVFNDKKVSCFLCNKVP